jgi:hypothetical protein
VNRPNGTFVTAQNEPFYWIAFCALHDSRHQAGTGREMRGQKARDRYVVIAAALKAEAGVRQHTEAGAPCDGRPAQQLFRSQCPPLLSPCTQQKSILAHQQAVLPKAKATTAPLTTFRRKPACAGASDEGLAR